MSDIVERLLNDAESHYEVARSADMRPEDTLNWEHGQNCQEAADTITRLTAEVRVRQTIVEEARDERDAALADVEKLRAALNSIAANTYGYEPDVLSDEEAKNYFAGLFFDAQNKARAALSGDKQ
jgi:hypothetical protein